MASEGQKQQTREDCRDKHEAIFAPNLTIWLFCKVGAAENTRATALAMEGGRTLKPYPPCTALPGTVGGVFRSRTRGLKNRCDPRTRCCCADFVRYSNRVRTRLAPDVMLQRRIRLSHGRQ